jgi:hypothetical protein
MMQFKQCVKSSLKIFLKLLQSGVAQTISIIGLAGLAPKLLDEDTKQLDEYEPEFVRNFKGLAKNEYEFQLSHLSARSSSPRHPLAENEYSIAGQWITGQNTEHGTLNTEH